MSAPLTSFVPLNLLQGPFRHPQRPYPRWMLKQFSMTVQGIRFWVAR